MNKYKVAVYAICKNEEKFVDRWLSSMSEADEIYVCDTGSIDNTVALLRGGGAAVNEIKVEPWRFDEARNISLSFVPEDTDICVCTDLDEVFEPGWRALLENAWSENVTRVKYNYTWSFNPDGSRGVTFMIEKIHRRKGFRWIHPVHEVLEYYGSDPDIYAFEKRIQLNHYPDSAKSRAQYLPLLEMSAREDPDDDRNMHYLGREYMFYGMWDKCIQTLKKHIEMPSAQWADEKSASMRFIARAYAAKGDYASCSAWQYRAIAEAPYLREPYAEAAIYAYYQNEYLKVCFMVSEALKIENPPLSYINEAFCRDSTLYDIAAVSCYRLGCLDESLKYAAEALRRDKANQRLRDNYELIKNEISRKQAHN